MTPLIYIIAFTLISIWITIAVEIEWFGWTTFTLIATVVAAKFFHLFDIIVYIKENAIQSIMYAIAYIAIGIIWSFAKWFFYLINQRDKDREYIKSNDNWSDYKQPTINVPQAANNKGKIVAWMCYWPFSFIGTILNDPFRKLFNFIFNQFKNLYQQMANSIYKNDLVELKNKTDEFIIQKIKKREELMKEDVIVK